MLKASRIRFKPNRSTLKGKAVMHVIFIHGPVASGKYTIANQLGAKLGLPLFHNHLTVDLVNSLFEFGSQPFISLREEIWLSAFGSATKAKKSFIFTFAPEATVNSDFVDKALATVRAEGGNILFIELTCSEDEIEKRLGEESRVAFGKLKSVEMYRQLKTEGSFVFPALPEPIVRIPTDQVDVHEAVEMIAEVVDCAV